MAYGRITPKSGDSKDILIGYIGTLNTRLESAVKKGYQTKTKTNSLTEELEALQERLESVLNNFHKLQDENERLRQEIEELKSSDVQKIKNERGAGRHSILTSTLISQIKSYHLMGKSQRQIADILGLAVGTVNKALRE